MTIQPTANPGVVIVGAGQAGCEVAFALRAAGYEGAIDLIGRESLPPYRRPPLSKQFIAEQGPTEALLIKPQAAFDKAAVTLTTGVSVTSINRTGQRAIFDDGRSIAYQHLILAIGGEARHLTLPGSDLAGVFRLRSVDDALALRAYFAAGKRLVVIGGGFVGLEVAALAIQHGLRVSVLEAAPHLLSRVTSPLMSAFYEDMHRGAGVNLKLSAVVEAFVGDDGHVTGVQCSDECIDADLVLVGVGMQVPEALPLSASLLVEHGIVTDAECRTDDPNIFAIGDCARSLRADGRHHRFESVPNAIEQARLVAQLITGKPAAAAQAPWFWSDQYDLKLQMVGLSAGYDQHVVRGDIAGRSFMVFYLCAGRVISADAVNRLADFNVAKKLVAEARIVDPAALADESRALKDIAA